MTIRLSFSLGLFLGSLALGWWLHRRALVTEAHATRLVRWIVVGLSPLVLPLLFGLERKLANALWLVTTALAIPWLLLIIPLLQRV